ncbi:hypothetical protein Godav_021092, partial [Gossypium davidsonii]|nr:hypothetical protein [Gossypium davidsonii]
MKEKGKVWRRLLPLFGDMVGIIGRRLANHHVVSRFLIRNDNGNLMGLRFRMHNLVRTMVLVEVMVVLHDFQFTRDMGFSRDVKNLARGFTSCRFKFITREGNTAVYAMASKGMKHLEDSFWFPVENVFHSKRRISTLFLWLVALIANLRKVFGHFGLLVTE